MLDLTKGLIKKLLPVTEEKKVLRAELLNLDQLAHYAENFARKYTLSQDLHSTGLLDRLDENEAILRTYNRATQSLDLNRRITPASEWLLDNFYLIEEQIQMARRHFPKEYSRELPCGITGLPRVYEIVLELISHVDAQVDGESLSAFITAFQRATPLKLGELWAVPIMLRLGLIENLQRITSRLAMARQNRDLAVHWISRLETVQEKNPSLFVVVMAEMAQSDLPLTSAFVAEFCQSLIRTSTTMHWTKTWFEQLLSEKGLSIDLLTQEENQLQAAEQVSVRQSITSLRFLGAMNWRDFVESMSGVEGVLKTDPQAVYSRMDFFTRDAYRHVVEEISAESRLSEIEVATRAVEMSMESSEGKGIEDRVGHVGYYLHGKGRKSLERSCHARKTWKNKLERTLHRFPKTFYLGGIFVLTNGIGFSLIFPWIGGGMGVAGEIGFSILVLLCSSQMAVAFMHWMSTLLLRPRLLPRLDFSKEIPLEQATMVVIPTLLASAKGIERLLETIEIHFLGNRDPHLYFAILTDFPDAASERMPEDEERLQQARAGIEALNQKYSENLTTSFFMFHRPRRWNPKESCWMGYERKRGKLSDLNSLLIQRKSDRFSEVVGNFEALPRIASVITLDTDTQMPREVARQMIGTMAHPLNRPYFDPQKRRVTEGYSILQPRVAASLLSSTRSWYGRLLAGEVGVDPYTRATSDVYQDLFGEGSFVGKGIYDVEAFEQATSSAFPENQILSHDLIESCYSRCALLSDVILYEDYPSSPIAEMKRQHRWIRGDWQIARWLRSTVIQVDGKMVRNPLTILSQWKIADNLRRSLLPAALLSLLVGSWCFFPVMNLFVWMVVVSTVSLSSLLSLFLTCFRKPKEFPIRLHLHESMEAGTRHLAQVGFDLLFLPSMAALYLDAMARTGFRLCVSGKYLLEWQTAGEVERSGANHLRSCYSQMAAAPLFSMLVVLVLMKFSGGVNGVQGILLGLWFFSPVVAWGMGRSREIISEDLDESQQLFLRRIARKTWRFFEVFVNERENYLPPDNFQEQPLPVIASRTSPTNIGLSLLSNLSAVDFGYLSQDRLVERIQKTFLTLDRMDRFQGHFYNWYDTRTLEPLNPRYISSVDSGNLAGHFLVLGSGLLESIEERMDAQRIFQGLHDTAKLLEESIGESPEMTGLLKVLSNPTGNLKSDLKALLLLSGVVRKLTSGEESMRSEEGRYWGGALERLLQDQVEDLLYLLPWMRGTPNFSPLIAFPAIQQAFISLEESLSLRRIAELSQTLCPLLEEAILESREPREMLGGLLKNFQRASERASDRVLTIERLSRQSDEFAKMDFNFLFDPERNLFTIGYNADECRRDRGYYDLLASESRLGSYVAIALGQVHQDHWFSLGRLLLPTEGGPILASWSGSLFEYLMPLLVMPNYPRTLLDQTYQECVAHQIEYGKLKEIPWGISESGYNRTDASFNYQYRAFGVPGLGLKRGLGEDLVIAPYAAVMGLMVSPQAACQNLERLVEKGFSGIYGFFEAIDYTPSRLPPGQSCVALHSFMAHHQGMSFLSLDYALHGEPMQRRFLASPLLKSTALLLQEKIPKTNVNILPDEAESSKTSKRKSQNQGAMRVFTTPYLPSPEIHLLTNGRYQMMISTAGGGYSRWQNVAMTRWREDATRDCWGSFFYLREVARGEIWSPTHQPTLRNNPFYEAIFTPGRAEFRQRFGEMESHTEICISPEDDVELRRMTLVNHSGESREIEMTSFAEVVLAPEGADRAHPAFSNLFVQTEYLPASDALLCTRRKRSESEISPWMFHLMIPESGEVGRMSYETDRMKFVGRGRDLARPAAMEGSLSNTVGPVLDPIVSIRRTIRLEPHQSLRILSVMGASDHREGALDLIERYHNPKMADRALELAWTHSQVILHHLNITEKEAQLYMQLAAGLVYPNAFRRASSSILLANRRTQSALWSYGISGDDPMVVLRIRDLEKMSLVQQMIQAHAFWRSKGLTSDLVILNEDESHYHQLLHERILQMIASGSESAWLDKRGGIYVRKMDQLPSEDRILLQAVAHLLLECENGSLEEQLQQTPTRTPSMPLLATSKAPDYPARPQAFRELIFHNGLGGFTPDGREYVIDLDSRGVTPAPWVNVIANPEFGTVVSEGGSAYSWSENCHEYRLTPWSNDPVSDPTGEAFYIRDEQTGLFWSPTPLPARGRNSYLIRHGFGYSVFEYEENGIVSELWISVAPDAPVKLVTLKLRNISGKPRSISVTGYWEWVLGDQRQKNQLHLQTQIDPKSGAIFVRNPYHIEFSERTVFVDVHESNRSVTGDRKEFIGRNGTLANPAAMKRSKLSGRVGAGFDPCSAIQVVHDFPVEGEKEITFRLGVGKNPGEVQGLIQRFRRPGMTQKTLQEVHEHWNKTVGAVQVESPDPAVNVMANGWLLYQTLSCRMWARTGFYQSGGAYGFRDQLQDSMALVHSKPGLIREHLLRAAAQQFREGDVQHWWHPPSGRGVRTHFSDDFLWLPYVLCHYVKTIGDTGVLDESVSFLEGRLLRSDEESNFDLPTRSGETATLYQHGVRAIERGFRYGVHGLPLIGCGDWNDGMNLVGKEGRGESVWLAFFFYDLLRQFAVLAENYRDLDFSQKCLDESEKLRLHIEKEAWDGEWYQRAFFDDGTPLGSHTNPECQIDSLPQSWSVLSGAGDPARSRQAMEKVMQRLVRREAGLIQLFDPPFESSSLNPGYIKGYIPGVRENGGQYTHGALWVTMAMAQLGETEKAWELFNLLNPVHHGDTPEHVATYKVEPYVVAADVYAVHPHIGRGGWTWYTGSSGWMYRLLMEKLIGVQLEGEYLRLSPLMPESWERLKIRYRYRQTDYRIEIERGDRAEIQVDGTTFEGNRILLMDDQKTHHVTVRVSQPGGGKI
jgi:cellobiose phosphorylase